MYHFKNDEIYGKSFLKKVVLFDYEKWAIYKNNVGYCISHQSKDILTQKIFFERKLI